MTILTITPGLKVCIYHAGRLQAMAALTPEQALSAAEDLIREARRAIKTLDRYE